MSCDSHSIVLFDAEVALEDSAYDSMSMLAGIPGEPSVQPTQHNVDEFLVRELRTPILDNLFQWLWLVAKRSGFHIDALHVQTIKGRTIFLAEDPNMHLITQPDRVYIKPIPLCILNRQFWAQHLIIKENPLARHLPPQSKVRLNANGALAAGLLRSYSCLIQHRSDLVIAKQNSLLPVECDWTQWTKFIATFRQLTDELVDRRYQYGQLRLSRLNWATRVLGPEGAPSRLFYHVPYWSIYSGLRDIAAPALFAFAMFSLALSALQVMLSIPISSNQALEVQVWFVASLQFVSLGLSLAVLVSFAVSAAAVILIPLAVLLWQGSWALKYSRTQ